jgi:hypothetical protein
MKAVFTAAFEDDHISNRLSLDPFQERGLAESSKKLIHNTKLKDPNPLIESLMAALRD